jgi:glucose/mannose transport system substrate-binding protein
MLIRGGNFMKLRSLVLGSTLALGALGCSGSDDSSEGDPTKPGETQDVLEIFSWWTAPGEAEALQALVKTYKDAHEGARVSQFSNGTAATWQEVLSAQIHDSPWDVFQLSASDIKSFSSDHEGDVANVDDIYEEAGLDDVMIPEIRNLITIDGHRYGVVTGVHRNNAFLYNKQIFDDQKLDPPITVEEFLTVSAQLKEANIMPVASDFDTWVLRILFDEILAGTMGAEGFNAFIKGDVAASDEDVKAQIASAIDTFEIIITEYVDVERSTADGYDWSSATQDLYDGKAAMLFHGDWAKGYLVHLGWTPGVDFGVLGPPGAADLFVYGADMFGLPTASPHPDLAKNFLKVVASPEGQVAFNSYKGSTPMRSDVRDQLDESGKLSLDGLMNAKVITPGVGSASWDKGIEAFVKDRNKEAFLQVYVDTTL